MSEPSKAAMITARRMWPVAATLSVNEMAHFIDRETGLPELVEAVFVLRLMARQAGHKEVERVATEALRKASEDV